MIDLDRWMRSGIEYGCDLIRAAVEGARSAEEQILEGKPPRSVLMRSARSSLAPGASVALLGLLAGYCVTRRRSAVKAVAFGLLGGAIGLVGGMAWGTRQMTGGMARGAIRKMSATRDAHWLSHHPVDYA